MGEYAFKEELKRGDRVVFLDQIHYSIVKNTTFNGIRLPNLMLLNSKNELEMVREFFLQGLRSKKLKFLEE